MYIKYNKFNIFKIKSGSDNVEEIVHIIPLGFEIDRAVKPFGKLKANRVYILYSKDGSPKNPSNDRETILNIT